MLRPPERLAEAPQRRGLNKQSRVPLRVPFEGVYKGLYKGYYKGVI